MQKFISSLRGVRAPWSVERMDAVWRTEIGCRVAHEFRKKGARQSAPLSRLFTACCGEFFEKGVVVGGFRR